MLPIQKQAEQYTEAEEAAEQARVTEDSKIETLALPMTEYVTAV